MVKASPSVAFSGADLSHMALHDSVTHAFALLPYTESPESELWNVQCHIFSRVIRVLPSAIAMFDYLCSGL